jgi:hypothetical protein
MDLKPAPKLFVAGVTISPPGAATHRKVARWFSGISRSSWLAVYVGSVVRFSRHFDWDARSAMSSSVGVTVVPAAVVVAAVILDTVYTLTWSAGVPMLPNHIS